MCSLLVCLRLNINFFQVWILSQFFLIQWRCLYLICLTNFVVSQPSDKLIQQLVHSLLKTQPVIVHQIMSLLDMSEFLSQWTYTTLPPVLCHSVTSNVYHSLALLFHSFRLSFPVVLASEIVLLHQSAVLLQYPLPNVIITMDGTPSHWAFYFGILGYLYPLVEPGQILCTMDHITI